MKKAIFIAVLLLPSITLGSIDFDLKYGSKGDEVIELQEYLIEKGFLNSNPTGNFYSLTQKAVIDYQKSVGLPSTGFVGPMTRAKINANLIDTTSAEISETGSTVEAVDTTKASILQNQIDELMAQLSILVEQTKTFTTPSGAVVTQGGGFLSQPNIQIISAPTTRSVPVETQPVAPKKDLRVFSYNLTNDTLSLNTNFPVNIQATVFKVKENTHGWEKTTNLTGQILEAQQHQAPDDGKSVYYTYSLKLSNPLNNLVKETPEFSNGDSTIILTSSDGDIVSTGSFAFPKVPTTLSVEQSGDHGYGGGCEAQEFRIIVLDQNGHRMSNQKVTLDKPYTIKTPTSQGEINYIVYTPDQVFGIVNLTFTSGNLSVIKKINVISFREYFYDMPDGTLDSNRGWISDVDPNLIIGTNGEKFNLTTNMCL